MLDSMESMLQSQHALAMARLAVNPNDRLASLMAKNRELALADLRAKQAEMFSYHLL